LPFSNILLSELCDEMRLRRDNRQVRSDVELGGRGFELWQKSWREQECAHNTDGDGQLILPKDLESTSALRCLR
jgi:hypothetical protein